MTIVSNVEHPGTIVFVNGDTDESNERKASEVPDAVRFADTNEGRVPVVRVVATTAGNQRHIKQYAADGRLLRTTVQVRTEPS